jgi:hypothetical protein
VRAILKTLGRALVVTAGAASVIGLAAAPAFAATWTVKPGGAVTATAGTTTIMTGGNTVTCTSSVIKGTLKKGSGLAGAGIGTASSLAFNKCTIAGITVSATITGTMPLNGVKYNSTTKVATMTLTKIHGKISVSSLGCSATVDGTGATKHNGMVTGHFSNGKDTLTVLTTGGNLHLYNPSSGCAGVITNGQAVTFTGAYKFAPKTTITSP